jgi:hypothetical protein
MPCGNIFPIPGMYDALMHSMKCTSAWHKLQIYELHVCMMRLEKLNRTLLVYQWCHNDVSCLVLSAIPVVDGMC